MTTRRNFIKKAALASGAFGLAGVLPESIQRAMAINPAAGTTWKDAEHVVILMQENRSFDHAYGSLQGVRGFNDPRAITLPDDKPVWFQTNKAGETFAPFRLNMKGTRATWMGSLPHSWTNQVDARNEGKMDKWLDEKESGHEPYAKMPLTLGYYNREDLPFYYSMADAFTVCDQNFCSSLTGTTPNRLYLWTGTIREAASEDVFARVNNEDADYNTMVSWKTFPERLEANGVSWKIYQNEVSVGVGLFGEEDAWLTNFGDNPIEYFTQFNIRFLPAYIKALPGNIARVTAEINKVNESMKTAAGAAAEKQKRILNWCNASLSRWTEDQKKYTPENYARLSPEEKQLHEKAFVTNTGDPHYHELETLSYKEGAEEREIKIPKGDLFHKFRSDVRTGNLPAVSWLVAPENLSDHPTSPWYGAAYVSEALDILTSDPEVWKKTIFILCYDENDGYFDHIAPFTAPNPDRPETGKTSKSVDARVDFVKFEQDKKWKNEEHARESPIGLGYRVPLVIASPWSRGGAVNSQVFDHTSIIQFVEKFASVKSGKKIEESNISSWRRAVCGDLTSVFTPWQGEKISLPVYVSKTQFFEDVHQAKFKNDPGNFHALSAAEIEGAIKNPNSSAVMPRQEKGVRTSRALPYEIYADGQLNAETGSFSVTLKSGNSFFGRNSAGVPFNVYAYGLTDKKVVAKAYAAAAGEGVSDTWNLKDFTGRKYHLKVYGPNGFFREFSGSENDPKVLVSCQYESGGITASGRLLLRMTNNGKTALNIEIKDVSYKNELKLINLRGGESQSMPLETSKSFGWYDVAVSTPDKPDFSMRYAGRIETGAEGKTDPAMA